MRIAILEDDLSQLELIRHWLQVAGHYLHPFRQGTLLLRALKRDSFDVLILDWNVPDISGIEVLRRVRQDLRSDIPIVFSTGRAAQADIVSALRQGADDYLVKPVRRLELLARLEAVHRRSAVQALGPQPFEIGPFRVDSAARTLLRNDRPLALTAKDFDLSAFFLCNVGRLLSRGHLLEAVWKEAHMISSRTLDTHVSRIRSKLLLTPEHGWRLTAVYGYGYRLQRIAESATSLTPHDHLAKARMTDSITSWSPR